MLEGVRHKPDHCKLCKYSSLGSGFCPDFHPSHSQPKLMLLLEQPFSADILNQTPVSGRLGNWFEIEILRPLGILRKNIILAHTLRCKPPNDRTFQVKADKGKTYPAASFRHSAEQTCRGYDQFIRQYDPEVFVWTYSINDTFKDPAYKALMIEDLKKAVSLSEKGYRVCVCMGSAAVGMISTVPFKQGKGGLKAWRGHTIFTKWPYE